MPWKETTQVQARVRFIEDWLAKEYESLAVLCRVHGVSRKTGYKWGGAVQGRRQARSKRPPQALAFAPAQDGARRGGARVGTRKRHPTWGPRKLRAWILGRVIDVNYFCRPTTTILAGAALG